MSGTKVRMSLFILVILGFAGLCHFAVNHKSAEKEKLASPPLDRTVAEGFRLWNPKAGVDSVSFESLMERTGLYAKRFSGIRVDGLSVNRVVNRSVVPVFAAERMKNREANLQAHSQTKTLCSKIRTGMCDRERKNRETPVV